MSHEIELAGYRWRVGRPRLSERCRVYTGVLSAASSGVISKIIARLSSESPESAEADAANEHESDEYAAARAIEILRQVDLGKALVASDYTTMLVWLAPALAGCSVEKVEYWAVEILRTCKLEVFDSATNQWGQLPSEREVFVENLDSLLDDYSPEERNILSIWAFLVIVRPSCAG